MKDFTIGLDVDGVLADFVGKVLYYQNSIFKTKFQYTDITSYHIENIIGESNLSLIFEIMEENRDIKYLDLYPGAIDLVFALRRLGRVVFVTAPCSKYRAWADDRKFWLEQRFSATGRDIVSLKDKTLFNGQVLIDDCSLNIEEWLNTNRPAIKVSQPWNKNDKGNSIDNLSDIPDKIMDIKYCYEFSK